MVYSTRYYVGDGKTFESNQSNGSNILPVGPWLVKRASTHAVLFVYLVQLYVSNVPWTLLYIYFQPYWYRIVAVASRRHDH